MLHPSHSMGGEKDNGGGDYNFRRIKRQQNLFVALPCNRDVLPSKYRSDVRGTTLSLAHPRAGRGALLDRTCPSPYNLIKSGHLGGIAWTARTSSFLLQNFGTAATRPSSRSRPRRNSSRGTK